MTPSAAARFFDFFSSPSRLVIAVAHVSKWLDSDEEEEEVEDDDVSVNEGDLSGQTRTPVRVLLLRAFPGIGVLKVKPVFPGSGAAFSVAVTGKEIECSEKQSSTKLDNHSKSATSSTYKNCNFRLTKQFFFFFCQFEVKMKEGVLYRKSEFAIEILVFEGGIVEIVIVKLVVMRGSRGRVVVVLVGFFFFFFKE